MHDWSATPLGPLFDWPQPLEFCCAALPYLADFKASQTFDEGHPGELTIDVPGQKSFDAVDRMFRDAGKHVAKIALRIDAVQLCGSHQAVNSCGALAPTVGSCASQAIRNVLPQVSIYLVLSFRFQSGRSSGVPCTVHAMPYQTSDVPDHRRILIVYVSPARAANSAIS